MENWRDQGIVLGVRPHGESGAVVALLTENYGRHAGYVHGAQSAKKRAMMEPGTLVDAQWSARTADSLGHYALEPARGLTGSFLDDPLRLGALLSACALCDEALPEREGHPGLFHGLRTMLQALESDHWGAVYVMWEIAFLRELGFGLDLQRCAGGGDASTLTHVSPKSGRAVSADKAAPYLDKLLILPDFLTPRGGEGGDDEVVKGLRMTGHFLEHWVFAHHSRGVPEARLRFEARYAKYNAGSNGSTQPEILDSWPATSRL